MKNVLSLQDTSLTVVVHRSFPNSVTSVANRTSLCALLKSVAKPSFLSKLLRTSYVRFFALIGTVTGYFRRLTFSTFVPVEE